MTQNKENQNKPFGVKLYEIHCYKYFCVQCGTKNYALYPRKIGDKLPPCYKCKTRNNVIKFDEEKISP